MNEFDLAAKEAGFTDEQIEFLNQFVAKFPHMHDVEDINGLEDAVTEIVEDADVDGTDEEE